MRRSLIAGAVAVALLPVSPALAVGTGRGTSARVAKVAADSGGTLVFIRNGNVWISRANGTSARAVTRDGSAKNAYRTPTQDDHGHVFALRGHGAKAVVSRLDQQGRVLNRYHVPISSFGPDFASVSPDGTKLAYETMFAANDCSYTPCHTFFQHYVEYARATTGAALPGGHHVTDGEFASWAGANRAVVQATQLNRVLLHRPSEASATEWFASCLSYQTGCNDTDTLNYFPAVNRQGTRFATSRVEDGPGGRTAYLLVLSATSATTAAHPPLPGAGCAHPGPTPTVLDPTREQMTVSAPSFSPSGRSVVFAQRSGSIWTTRVYTPVIGDCNASDPVTVLGNAAEPHWSSATLSPPALIWTRAKHPKLKVAKARKVKVGGKLEPAMKKVAIRRGFAPDAGKLRFQWLRNGRAIKHATKATYRIRKADRHKKIRLRITGRLGGHANGTVTTKTVKVK